uniref:Lysozyme C, milk isozyme n=1 Tax=Lygus hesperus TaxID=30085 RepID=A0A0A9Z4I0_LYGHE
MRSVALILCAIALAASFGECLVFSPSELASKLRSLKVPDWDIPTLVCVAHNASNLKTDYVGSRTDIGYNYYGIFGVPDKLFGHQPCSHLNKQLSLDENIEDDLRCLMNMIKNEGYLPGNRSSNLGVFTPHDIDLAKCFDWWESLPPFNTYQTNQNQSEKILVNFTETKMEPSRYSLVCSTGIFTNLLLLLLNVILSGLLAVGYFIYKQLRPLSHDPQLERHRCPPTQQVHTPNGRFSDGETVVSQQFANRPPQRVFVNRPPLAGINHQH